MWWQLLDVELVVGHGFKLAARVGPHQRPSDCALLAALRQGQHHTVLIQGGQGVQRDVESRPLASACRPTFPFRYYCGKWRRI